MWDQLGSGKWKEGPQAAQNQFADLESGLSPCLVGRRVERVPVPGGLDTAALEHTHLPRVDAGQHAPGGSCGEQHSSHLSAKAPLAAPPGS